MKKLKEKLSAKLSKNGGFTLVEMLIVVAIIAILIAISIPLVGSALENARKATDAANERAFKGVLVSSYLLNEAGMSEGDIAVEAGTVYYYDAVDGKVDSTKTTGYNQSKIQSYAKGQLFLAGYVKSDGEVTMAWVGNTVTTDQVDSLASRLISPGLIKK